MAAAPIQNWVGSVLAGGRYRVTAKLGEGGMGFVYRAHDANLSRDVVIKVPRPSVLEDPGFAGRFSREIRSLVALSHPSIVKVLDVGQHDGVPFAVMEYLPGGSLKDRLCPNGAPPRARPPAELAGWLEAMADAIDFLHKQGYVHRDIKPDNILFDGHGHVFLGDFGVVKALAAAEQSADRKTMRTEAGVVVGTAPYMAPELFLGQSFDGRVDQYALAVTAFEMLSGRVPFDGPTPTAIFLKQSQGSAPAVHSVCPGVSESLSAALQKGLAEEPGKRYPSCTAFARAVLAAVSAAPAKAGDPATRQVACAHCGKTGSIPVSARVKRFRCPACGQATPLGAVPASPPPVPKETGRSGAPRQPFPPPVAAGLPNAPATVLPPGLDDWPAPEEKGFARSRGLVIGGGLALAATAALVVWLLIRNTVGSPTGTGPVTEAKPVPRLLPLAPITLTAGEKQRVPVRVERRGFQGPIALTLDGLPDKVTARPGTIEAGQDAVELELVAADDAQEGQKKVGVRLGEEVAENLAITVQKPKPSLRLAELAAVTVEPGQGRRVEVRVQRRACPGPIEVKFDGLPAKVTAPDAFIAADRDSVQVELTAASDAEAGQADVRVRLSAAAAREEGRLVVTVQKAAPRLLPIGTVSLEPGRAGKIDLRVERRGLQGELRLQVEGLPDKVSAKPGVIAADQDGGTILLTAAADAPEGEKQARVVLAGTNPPVEGKFTVMVKKGTAVGPLATLTGSREIIWGVAISPDGRQALSAGGGTVKAGKILPTPDNFVRLWDLADGKPRHSFKGHKGVVHCVAFAPNGKVGVSGGLDSTLRLWDLEKLKQVRVLGGNRVPVMSVAFSADGRYLLSGSQDGAVMLWEVANGNLLRRLVASKDIVSGVAISPENREAIAGGADATVRLWDLESQREIRSMDKHTKPVICVALSPDGKQALSGGADSTVRLWNVETGKEVHCLEGHTDWVNGVAFSPDGKRALSASNDRTVRLWDLETGTELYRFEGHTDFVRSVAYAPDGRFALSGGLDRTLRVWNLPK